MLRRLPLVPTVMTLVFLLVLTGLGTWQVARLVWKNDLISSMYERVTAPAQDLPLEGFQEYQHVRLVGEFRHDKEAYLQTTGPNGKAGYDVYTPLHVMDGRWVIVNRGWVPSALKDPALRPADHVGGQVSVVGLVRGDRKPLWYMPANNTTTNIWFTPIITEMADFMGLENPVDVFVDADATPNAGGYPVGGQTVLDIPNNHLDYALTWYGLALVLLVIYLLYIRRALKDEA